MVSPFLKVIFRIANFWGRVKREWGRYWGKVRGRVERKFGFSQSGAEIMPTPVGRAVPGAPTVGAAV